MDFVHKIGCHGNAPWGIAKNSFSSLIFGQRSTNPANFVKLGPEDVEIIGVTEITKIFFENITKT